MHSSSYFVPTPKYIKAEIRNEGKTGKTNFFKYILKNNPSVSTQYIRKKYGVNKFNNYIKFCYEFQKVDRIKGFPPKNNTYRLFIEKFFNACSKNGCCGIIVPLGITADEGCVSIKRDLLFPKTNLGIIYGFRENNDYFQVKQPFAIFSFAKGKTTKDVLFYNGLTNLKDVNSKKNIPVSVDLLESLSSEALIFEIENDIELSLFQKIHNNPTIEKIIENKLLDIDFGSEEINETRSSRYLIQEASGVPLLKGNNITAFLKPICSKYVQKQHFCEKAKNNFYNFPRLIWGNVRNLNMSKRMCFTLCPPNYAIGNSLNYIVEVLPFSTIFLIFQ